MKILYCAIAVVFLIALSCSSLLAWDYYYDGSVVPNDGIAGKCSLARQRRPLAVQH